MQEQVITTSRLVLRPWQEEDLEPFAILNADPRVMEHFPSVLSREESDSFAHAIIEHFQQRGWGLWAVSLCNEANFIGFIGLSYITFEAPFTPAVEVGWRLAYDHWGKGYATEGALASLQFGFETLLLDEIISVTAVCNERSKRVMECIGMTHNARDDFDHPKLPEGHRLRRHVLYRIQRHT